MSKMMSLYFSRRRFFETSFYAPNVKNYEDGFYDLAEVYHVSATVHGLSIFPGTITIESLHRKARDNIMSLLKSSGVGRLRLGAPSRSMENICRLRTS